MKIVLTLICFLPIYLIGQSLTQERVEKLKNAVVKITIEGDPSTGTGFFVAETGEVLTCWHVIQPSIVLDSNGTVVGARRIYIQLRNGNKIPMGIMMEFISKPYFNMVAVSNDFCILIPLPNALSEKITFLKIGNFDDINEGDEIYTAGYPLGLPYQFISKGILSTKYIDSSLTYHKKGNPDVKVKKYVALLDLTLNKGNSGGPIIKIGKTIEEDEVIGIANFLINPFGENAEKLNEAMNKDKVNYFLSSGVSLTESMKLFSNAIIYSSNGISGCVSINHFSQLLK